MFSPGENNVLICGAHQEHGADNEGFVKLQQKHIGLSYMYLIYKLRCCQAV